MGETFGRYELVKRLGFGGMAEAWRARYTPAPGLSKDVVLKRILPVHAEDPDFRAMFLSETRLTLRLSHGNVVQVFDAGEVEGQLFLAMEFVDGVSLLQVLERAQARGLPGLPPVLAVLVVIEMLKGLHHAHTRSDDKGRPLELVHRDVSPDNVLISFDGDVKVADFGIARARMAGRRATMPGIFKGKLSYAAPEQARAEKVDGRADLYSSALVLYELISGKNPAGEEMMAVGVASGIRTLPRFPVELADPEFVNIISRALEAEPENRQPSVLALQQALSQWVAPKAQEHAASGVAEMMRWLFPAELKARYPGHQTGPGVESWLALAGRHVERASDAKKVEKRKREVSEEPTVKEKPPAFELPPSERPEPPRAPIWAALILLAVVGGVGATMAVLSSTSQAQPDPEHSVVVDPRPLPPPRLSKPDSTPDPPTPTPSRPEPKVVTVLDKAPASFVLSDSHRFSIDANTLVQLDEEHPTPTLLKPPNLSSAGPFMGLLPVFAGWRTDNQLAVAVLPPGRPLTPEPPPGDVFLFSLETQVSPDLAMLTPGSVKTAPGGAAIALTQALIQLTDERRVTLNGLVAQHAHAVVIAPDDLPLTGPVVVMAQARGSSPARVAGRPIAAALGSGAYLVTGAMALHFAVPTIGGVTPRAARVEVFDLNAKEPGITTSFAEARGWFEKGLAELAKGRFDAAQAALAKGLKGDPQNANGHWFSCVAAFARGDAQKAAFECEAFLLFSPVTDPNRLRAARMGAQLASPSDRVPAP